MTAGRTRVVLASAYSTKNPGDGLLVDLTLEAIRRVRPQMQLQATIAIDPESFDTELRSVSPLPLAPGTARKPDLVRTARAVRDSDVIVAVGGGYLRWESARERLNCSILHISPLAAFSRARPTVLMPQSIGPFAGARRGLPASVERLIDRVDRCYVRDDESLALLQGYPSVVRVPDLAVLRIVERLDARSAQGRPAPEGLARVVLAPRAPRNGRGKRDEVALTTLARRLGPSARWAYQSDIGRDNSDRSYVQDLAGSEPVQSLHAALAEAPSVVVAGRLHAALHAIAGGVPAIHLGYDRKSRGCYRDLGIGRWCYERTGGINAEELADMIESIVALPCEYWRELHAGTDAIRPMLEWFSSDLDMAISGDPPAYRPPRPERLL